PPSPSFPYTTLFRSGSHVWCSLAAPARARARRRGARAPRRTAATVPRPARRAASVSRISRPAVGAEARGSQGSRRGGGAMNEVIRPLAAPAIVVRADNAREARRFMLRCLRKPVDGLISRTINRPISLAMSSLFVETPITPNQLTILTFVVALVAAALMTQGHFFLGACVMQFSSILDGCDGEVARLKYQSSRLGGWLDTILDDVSNQIFLLSTAWGVYHHEATGLLRTLVLAAAIGAFVLGALSLFFV